MNFVNEKTETECYSLYKMRVNSILIWITKEN